MLEGALRYFQLPFQDSILVNNTQSLCRPMYRMSVGDIIIIMMELYIVLALLWRIISRFVVTFNNKDGDALYVCMMQPERFNWSRVR